MLVVISGVIWPKTFYHFCTFLQFFNRLKTYKILQKIIKKSSKVTTFLLPYHVTFIIYVTKTAFYHYRLQEKAIKKVLKNVTFCVRKSSIIFFCYFICTLCYFYLKIYYLCQEIKSKTFLLFSIYPLLFLVKNLVSFFLLSICIEELISAPKINTF